MEDTTRNPEGPGGLDRRSLLRRSALVGGALVWTVPAVQTLAGPAFAAGSNCVPDTETDINGHCVEKTHYTDGAGAGSCCTCYTNTLALIPPGTPGASNFAVAYCTFFTHQCTATDVPC